VERHASSRFVGPSYHSHRTRKCTTSSVGRGGEGFATSCSARRDRRQCQVSSIRPSPPSPDSQQPTTSPTHTLRKLLRSTATPADESPPLLAFTPTVSAIQAHVDHTLQRPVNHVLTQLYQTTSQKTRKRHRRSTSCVARASVKSLTQIARD
jgi:hypothetical protein